MSARELLDTYAAEKSTYLSAVRRDAQCPKAFAALEAVLELHQRDSDDNCTTCRDEEGVPHAYPCQHELVIREALQS